MKKSVHYTAKCLMIKCGCNSQISNGVCERAGEFYDQRNTGLAVSKTGTSTGQGKSAQG